MLRNYTHTHTHIYIDKYMNMYAFVYIALYTLNILSCQRQQKFMSLTTCFVTFSTLPANENGKNGRKILTTSTTMATIKLAFEITTLTTPSIAIVTGIITTTAAIVAPLTNGYGIVSRSHVSAAALRLTFPFLLPLRWIFTRFYIEIA